MSLGMSPLTPRTIVDRTSKPIDSRANSRVEPRRWITRSIGSSRAGATDEASGTMPVADGRPPGSPRPDCSPPSFAVPDSSRRAAAARQARTSSGDGSDDARCAATTSGYASSCAESGNVSKPSGGGGGAGGGGDAAAPSATRLTVTSRSPSTSRRRFSASSTKPSTRRARTSSAAATARKFASRVPSSQNECRYVLAWYFQALRQNVLVHATTMGARAIAGSPAVAATIVPRWSPSRSRRSAKSWAPKWYTPAARSGRSPHAR